MLKKFEVDIWKLKFKVENWSWYLNLKKNKMKVGYKIWSWKKSSWNLKLEFKVEKWNWNLDLKFKRKCGFVNQGTDCANSLTTLECIVKFHYASFLNDLSLRLNHFYKRGGLSYQRQQLYNNCELLPVKRIDKDVVC